MPSSKVRPTPATAESFLSFRLVVLAETITRASSKMYDKRFGLSIVEGRVLVVISANGPQTTQQIIDLTQLDRVRVSRAVIRLSDKGLITRFSKPNDLRAQILDATPAGRAIYLKIIPLGKLFEATLTSSLTPEELRQLDRILFKLSSRANELTQLRR